MVKASSGGSPRGLGRMIWGRRPGTGLKTPAWTLTGTGVERGGAMNTLPRKGSRDSKGRNAHSSQTK
jgi:hypothetical protein